MNLFVLLFFFLFFCLVFFIVFIVKLNLMLTYVNDLSLILIIVRNFILGGLLWFVNLLLRRPQTPGAEQSSLSGLFTETFKKTSSRFDDVFCLILQIFHGLIFSIDF